MSWEQMKKAKEEGGNSMFIRLKDGDSVEGVFRGQPHTFYQSFGDRAEYDKWAEGRSFKFKINFVVNEAGHLNVKIFQGGATIRDAILDAKEEYGLDCIYKIKRTGSTKEDTRYAVLFKQKLTPEGIEAVNAMELKRLTSDLKEPSPDGAPPPEDNPFPEEF